MDNRIKVKNSRFIELPKIVDGTDGIISVAENFNHIPFSIQRVYYIYGLNNPEAIRGKHAHRQLEQVLFCINGSCRIGLDDGFNRQNISLTKPNQGIYLGIELWHTMEKFSDNCILMVLASDVYKEDDYIRDYNDFIRYVHRKEEEKKPR